jgi:hypothetical protein
MKVNKHSWRGTRIPTKQEKLFQRNKRDQKSVSNQADVEIQDDENDDTDQNHLGVHTTVQSTWQNSCILLFRHDYLYNFHHMHHSTVCLYHLTTIIILSTVPALVPQCGFPFFEGLHLNIFSPHTWQCNRLNKTLGGWTMSKPFNHLTQLLAWESFIEFSCQESFGLYNVTDCKYFWLITSGHGKRSHGWCVWRHSRLPPFYLLFHSPEAYSSLHQTAQSTCH